MDTSVEIVNGSLPFVFPRDAAFKAALCLWLGSALWCFVASLVTKTYSHVDRMWSIVPAVYVVLFAIYGGTARGWIMAALSALWCVRLTWNFARKGGYSAGEQDYRWPALQKNPYLQHPLAWFAFNVLFICLYQQFLLMLITLPAYIAHLKGAASLNALDGVATALFLGFLVLETVADEQQWVFQTAKYGKRPKRAGFEDDYRRGFLTQGLFAYSRHPNFFAEQCIWISFYIFSVAAIGGGMNAWLTNWSGLGAFLLVLLFQGSTWFTELLTVDKYPLYRCYQLNVSRLVPMPPKDKIDFDTYELFHGNKKKK